MIIYGVNLPILVVSLPSQKVKYCTKELYTLNSLIFDNRIIFACDYGIKEIIMFNYALRKIKVICAGGYRKNQYPLNYNKRFSKAWNFSTWNMDYFGRTNSMRLLRTKTFKNEPEFQNARKFVEFLVGILEDFDQYSAIMDAKVRSTMEGKNTLSEDQFSN